VPAGAQPLSTRNVGNRPGLLGSPFRLALQGELVREGKSASHHPTALCTYWFLYFIPVIVFA